jgi:DNA mismatch endonuclease (patch repair protein)
MADTFSPSERSRIMGAVRSRDTRPELLVRQLLRDLGYAFRVCDRELPGVPDIVLRKLKTVIFVSGCFWHMHKCGRCRIPKTRRAYWTAKLAGNRSRDVSNRRRLRRLGWSALTVWECQTKDEGRLSLQLQAKLQRRADALFTKSAPLNRKPAGGD